MKHPRAATGAACALLLALLILCPLHGATAQETAAKVSAAQASSTPAPSAANPAAPPTEKVAKAASERYRIGPGDLLDIRVFNKPQFSRDGVRVDSRGMIRMPFI
jgi:protein involved in polysaccharide export with SLBB domain